jgi:RHS repeat-associated protein
LPGNEFTSGGTHFYLANHRGDTVMTLTGTGSADSHWQYDAFGNALTNSGSFTPRYTFSTKEFLSDAKLYLYAYRVYDPQAGRWTQRDPIDYQDSLNLYQFCGNSPLLVIDRDGCVFVPLLAKWAFRIFSCKRLGDGTIEGESEREAERKAKIEEEQRIAANKAEKEKPQKKLEEKQKKSKEERAAKEKARQEFYERLFPTPAKSTAQTAGPGNNPPKTVTIEKKTDHE